MQLLAAPIQEYTDAAFRNAHFRSIGGIDEYYTPFIRLENGQLSPRAQKDIAPENNRCLCVVPQILVKSAVETQTLLEKLISLGYERVDFNFCCPFPKVTTHGYGAGILPSPDALQEVLDTAIRYDHISFSAKLRLGMNDDSDCVRILPKLNSFPFTKIVLHPRTAKQQYGERTNMEAFRYFKETCHCPVFYNGDIRQPQDAVGLDCIMVGRGLLANPLLPLMIRGQNYSSDMLKSFHDAYVEECQKLYQQPLLKLKLIWDYLLPEADKKTRKAIKKSVTLEEYLHLANGIIA